MSSAASPKVGHVDAGLSRHWNQFYNKANGPSKKSNAGTYEPKLHTQLCSGGKAAQELHNNDLEEKCDRNDDQKKWAVMDIDKYVEPFRLPGIDLVEELAKHKGIKDDSISHGGCIGPFQTKHLIASKLQQ